MNICIFVGRLTRDPETTFTGDNRQVTRFSIAVDRKYKGPNGETIADFFNCVTFERMAEFAEQYMRKGMRFAIQGEMRNNNYKNKSGETVYSMVLYVSSIEFADGKGSDGNQNESHASGMNQAPSQTPAPGGSGTRSASASQAAPTGTASRSNTGRAQKSSAATSQTPPAQTAGQRTGSTGRRSSNTGGKTTSGRGTSGGAATENDIYGDGFMNIPDGVEDEGLPFR